MLKPEPCNEKECQAQVERSSDGSRCGGVLFGTRDDPGDGCGRFFCGEHLVGHRGPFYCQPCWDKRKKVASRDPALEPLRALDDQKPVVIDEARLRRLRARCVALTEDLDDLRQFMSAFERDDTKAVRMVVAPADYMLEVRVSTRLDDDGKWEATCDHERWEKGHPDRGTAISAAVKAELKRILKNMEQGS